MAKIPDKNMMEWGMLGTTIICLLDIEAYKRMREDLTLKKSASDLIQCRKFELAMRLLTLRLLMSYIYIYICGAPILDVSTSHTMTQHSR